MTTTTTDEPGRGQRARRERGERRTTPARALVLPSTMTVQYLAEVLNQSPIDVIKQLMRNGIMASMNQVIDYQVATLVTTALGIRTSMAPEPDASCDQVQRNRRDRTKKERTLSPGRRW